MTQVFDAHCLSKPEWFIMGFVVAFENQRLYMFTNTELYLKTQGYI